MVSVAHVSGDRKTVGEILKQKSIPHTEKGGGRVKTHLVQMVFPQWIDFKKKKKLT